MSRLVAPAGPAREHHHDRLGRWIARAALALALTGGMARAGLPGSSSANALARPAVQQAPRNPVSRENNQEAGTYSWLLGPLHAPSGRIDGFASPPSVNLGGQLTFYLSAASSRLDLDIYRLGWYGGQGGRLLLHVPHLAAPPQPVPRPDPHTGLAVPSWKPTYTLRAPITWVSGVYLAKLTDQQGYQRYVRFTVRDDSSRAAVLFQSSLMTEQAYNRWSGKSLYGDISVSGPRSLSRRAYAVTLDRPLLTGNGAGSQFLTEELSLLRWLERNGADLTYTTDWDSAHSPESLRGHRVVLIAGHSEYWPTGLRDNLTAARDGGVSLAVFGANAGFWHTRLTADSYGADRVIVCYKDAALDPVSSKAPAETTMTYRDARLSRPEDTLLGAMYDDWMPGLEDLVVPSGTDPLFRGVGLQAGDHIPLALGSEYDRVFDTDRLPSTLRVLLTSPVTQGGDGPSQAEQVTAAYDLPTPARASVLRASVRSASGFVLALSVRASDGHTYQVSYDTRAGPPQRAGRSVTVHLGVGLTDWRWHNISRDVAADLANLTSARLIFIQGLTVQGNLRLGPLGLWDHGKLVWQLGIAGSRGSAPLGWRYSGPPPLPTRAVGSPGGILDVTHDAVLGQDVLRLATLGRANMANTTIYTARSGARVFNAGTLVWGSTLDHNPYSNGRQVDPRMDRLTRAILRELGAPLPTP